MAGWIRAGLRREWGPRGPRLPAAQLRVEGVPQRVAEEAEAEHREADRHAGEEADPRRLLGVGGRGAGQHQAPGRRGLGRAET